MEILFTGLALTKILISVLMVVLLSEVAKRVNASLAGILVGLPLGAGLSVYFIAYEQGVDFLIPAIPWGIAGLSAAQLFCLAYVKLGLASKQSPLVAIVLSSLGGMAVFLGAGAIIRLLDLSLVLAVLAFAVLTFMNIRLVQSFPEPPPAAPKQTLGFGSLLIRGIITGCLILVITAVAPLLGSRWAGVLSAFPSTLYAMVVLLHYDRGNELYPAVIKSFAYSVTTLAVFYMGCYFIIPLYGLNGGFSLVYLLSAGYLVLLKRCL